MQKIGNIIGKGKLPLSNMFNKSMSNDGIETGLPVLYIGIDNARNNIDNFSLFNERYENDVFWTPSKTEKRDIFIEKTDKFVKFCLSKITTNIKYEYVNITCYGYNRLKKLLTYIKSKDLKYCFITRESRFIFFYSPKYNTVWGLSLSLCEYVGVPKSKILNIIRKNKNNLIINNINDYTAEFEELRKMFSNDTHMIPIIYYLTTS